MHSPCRSPSQPLPRLQLQELELSTNRLGFLPACMAAMAGLRTLALLGNTDMCGLPPGAYQRSLVSLNLQGMAGLECR
jgi:hypothetical protein